MSLPLDDPRPAPSERDGLVDYLEYYRQVLRRKVDGLSSADLNRTVGASTLTLGGIIKHLSLVEYSWFLEDILGEDLPEPFATIDWRADPDWDFRSAADDSLRDLLDRHETACT
ncbi:DinB family protein, partial [Burkholderia multivorans]